MHTVALAGWTASGLDLSQQRTVENWRHKYIINFFALRSRDLTFIKTLLHSVAYAVVIECVHKFKYFWDTLIWSFMIPSLWWHIVRHTAQDHYQDFNRICPISLEHTKKLCRFGEMGERGIPIQIILFTNDIWCSIEFEQIVLHYRWPSSDNNYFNYACADHTLFCEDADYLALEDWGANRKKATKNRIPSGMNDDQQLSSNRKECKKLDASRGRWLTVNKRIYTFVRRLCHIHEFQVFPSVAFFDLKQWPKRARPNKNFF